MPDTESEQIARRLIITEQAIFEEFRIKSSSELCRRIGIKDNRWSQFKKLGGGENARTLTLEVAHKLCDEFDLTLDWLYRGNLRGLTVELRARLAAIQARPAA